MKEKQRQELINRLARLREKQYGDNASPEQWQELEDQCLAIIDYLELKDSETIKITA